MRRRGKRDHGWVSEAEMAASVVVWLEEQGFDVYQEVEHWSGVADIIGVKGAEVWAVECKLTLSFASLAQALSWKHTADRVFMAVPDYQWTMEYNSGGFPEGWQTGFRCMQNDGIGLILAGSKHPHQVKVKHDATLNKTVPGHRNKLIGSLRPQHKTFAKAGSPTGRRFTPFKGTCEALVAFVKERGGACTLKEASVGIKHHYRTPGSFISCMRKLIGEKEAVPGLLIDEAGNVCDDGS